MSDEKPNETPLDLEKTEQAFVQFYINSKKSLTDLRDIFLKLNDPEIANWLTGVIRALEIKLDSYAKAKQEVKDNAK